MAKHPGGAPRKLTETMIAQAQGYLDDTGNFLPAALLPTVEGLAIKLGISRETIYAWRDIDEPLYRRFSDIIERLKLMQGEKLIQKGLSGQYNPTIAKLILSGKHGYVEKTESDTTHHGEVAFTNGVPRPQDDETDLGS